MAVECSNVKKSFVEPGDKKNGAHKPFSLRMRDLIRPRSVKVDAVGGVSFQVQHGEIFGMLGPNGSGKSTLVRLISTLLLPDEGRISVFGRDVVEDKIAVRRMINRVSVEASFFKRLSAVENLEYASRLYGIGVSEGRKTALDILSRLGFEEKKAYTSVENLSRGMQQKVAIARALLTSPKLLLLDEPTTGLDPVSKRDVQDFVLEVRRNHGTTVILTTHDMQEAERMCDRIAIIDSGHFLMVDAPENLRKTYSEGDIVPTLEEVFVRVTGKSLASEGSGEDD